jgi:hypothetical protein
MKSKRIWLEDQRHSNSAVIVTALASGWVDLILKDCSRTVSWEFGSPGDRRAVAKIKKLKAIVDEVHEHLTKKKKKDT